MIECAVFTAQFEIEPESVVQAEGLEAVFECLVPGEFVSYSWIVNGLGSGNARFPSEIEVSGGTSGNPSVLTIPASSQFNNSVVQCIALSLSSGVLSRNVTLTFGKSCMCTNVEPMYFFSYYHTYRTSCY